MNTNKRMIIGLIVMPLLIVVMICGLFIKNYINGNFNKIESAIYINGGTSILVAAENADTSNNKIKFYEIDTKTNKVINSFSLDTIAMDTFCLTYDNGKALIAVIGDASKNSALSVYYIYSYESGKTPVLISSDIQSDTNLLNLFEWRGSLSVIDKDVKGDEAAIYIKDGKVTKQDLSNTVLADNIKKYANDSRVKDSDEVPYAQLIQYDGSSTFVGMFLNSSGSMPIISGEKASAIKYLCNILYSNTNVIALNNVGSQAYNVIMYPYSSSQNKTILAPETVFYNAVIFYPSSSQTIVIGNALGSADSKKIGCVFDNATGNKVYDLTNALKNVDEQITSDCNVYISGNNLCVINSDKLYTYDISSAQGTVTENSALLSALNSYSKTQLSSILDYAQSSQGQGLLYNLGLWLIFPVFMTIYSLVMRKKKKTMFKGSTIITGTITSFTPSEMHMYGMTYMEFEVEAYYEGERKVFKLNSGVPNNQYPSIGQSIVLLYDPKTDKAVFANEKMVSEALGKPTIEEVIIKKIEKIDEFKEGVNLVKLYVNLRDNKEAVVPGIESDIMPYKTGEKINIRYMSNTIGETSAVLGRGNKITGKRQSYSGEAEIIEAYDTGKEYNGRYVYDLDILCKAKIGSVEMDNMIFTKDKSVLAPGIKIAFSSDKELFEKRMRLQSMLKGTAVVKEITPTNDSVGYSPIIDFKLEMKDVNGDIIILAVSENISPLKIPKVGDRLYIGYDAETKEATILKILE